MQACLWISWLVSFSTVGSQFTFGFQEYKIRNLLDLQNLEHWDWRGGVDTTGNWWVKAVQNRDHKPLHLAIIILERIKR
jgi:hypothetical protein